MGGDGCGGKGWETQNLAVCQLQMFREPAIDVVITAMAGAKCQGKRWTQTSGLGSECVQCHLLVLACVRLRSPASTPLATNVVALLCFLITGAARDDCGRLPPGSTGRHDM
jgi:hypothetical protein